MSQNWARKSSGEQAATNGARKTLTELLESDATFKEWAKAELSLKTL